MKKDIQKRVLRRLKIIEGQLKGLEKMIIAEKYCVDILIQSSAIKQAISSLDDLILENHLSTHVIQQIKSGYSHKAINEILNIYKLSKKNK